MKAALVMTTTKKPTVALIKYKDILLDSGCDIIIVGDENTPPEYYDFPGIDYLSIERQHQIFGELASLIPFNHCARRNLGYLYAMQNGAEWIAEVHEGNRPYLDKFPGFLPAQSHAPVLKDKGAVNIYTYFTDRRIWPRGVPVDRINTYVDYSLIVEDQEVNCYIQQVLTDGNTDVDSIYRLTLAGDDEFYFYPYKRLALGEGCYAPFNTHHTLFYQEAFPLMLLPISVPNRVSDIWRSYIAQKILWCMGGNMLFLSPSSSQVKQDYDLGKDFDEEVLLFTHTHKLMNLLDNFTPNGSSAFELLPQIYDHLNWHKFISDTERQMCQLWLNAVKNHVVAKV